MNIEEFDEINDEYIEDEDQATFVCEDCDYRWEIDDEDDEFADEEEVVCKMCGSSHISEF